MWHENSKAMRMSLYFMFLVGYMITNVHQKDNKVTIVIGIRITTAVL